MQWAVIVTEVKEGPHELTGAKFVVRLILVGLLALVLRVTPWVFGAHLKESPTLPELVAPLLPENCIRTGLIDQRTFGAEAMARSTARYAPAITRLIESPTMRCGT